MYVIIMFDTIMRGFDLVGPFEDQVSAMVHAERNCGNLIWEVAKLSNPKDD